MPELPSVERGRRLLEDYLVNKKIIDVNANESGGGPRDGLFDDIVFKNAKDGILPKDIVKTLKGKIVTASKRKGKYLWISLKDDNTTNNNNNNQQQPKRKKRKVVMKNKKKAKLIRISLFAPLTSMMFDVNRKTRVASSSSCY